MQLRSPPHLHDDKLVVEATLEEDPRRKTRVQLPKNTRLRSLEIRIVASGPSILGAGTLGPGFNELDLVRGR